VPGVPAGAVTAARDVPSLRAGCPFCRVACLEDGGGVNPGPVDRRRHPCGFCSAVNKAPRHDLCPGIVRNADPASADRSWHCACAETGHGSDENRSSERERYVAEHQPEADAIPGVTRWRKRPVERESVH